MSESSRSEKLSVVIFIDALDWEVSRGRKDRGTQPRD